MNFPRQQFAILGLALLGAGMAAQAHHSLSGVFDVTRSFEIEGLVSRVDWMNPHVYVYIDGKDANGKPMTYRLESLPVAMMRKAGLSKTTLLGDGKPVQVHAHPARNGNPDLGYMLTIKFADGREIQFSKIPGAETVTPK